MSGWQPICDAPKDRRILLLTTLGTVVCGRWDEQTYHKNPRPYWRHDLERHYGVVSMRKHPPTHFQLLPQLPWVDKS